jgi:hypothetical protein
MLSINDSAAGSPQTASLSGTGVIGTTQETLTGECWGGVKNGAPNNVGLVMTPMTSSRASRGKPDFSRWLLTTSGEPC